MAAEERQPCGGRFARPFRAVRLHDQDEQPRRRLRLLSDVPGRATGNLGALSGALVRWWQQLDTATSRDLALDNCFFVDPVINRCVMDGVAGARNDLSASPNVDIANGAPTGIGAPNTVVNNYITGPALGGEKVYVT